MRRCDNSPHVTQAGPTLVGRSESADVQLGGALVQEEHAVIDCTEAGIIFRTIGDSIAFVNGSTAMLSSTA